MQSDDIAKEFGLNEEVKQKVYNTYIDLFKKMNEMMQSGSRDQNKMKEIQEGFKKQIIRDSY